MAKLFDTHAHYFAEKFNELEGGADAILSSDKFKEKIGGVICVGSDPSNVHISTDLARKYDFMYAAVGIHPDDAQNMCKKSPDEEIYDCVESLIADEVTRKENKIVAIGEIGFDYFYKTADKPLQREYFSKQMSLAKKYGLPVIIHNRNSQQKDCGFSFFVIQLFIISAKSGLEVLAVKIRAGATADVDR